MCHPWQKHLTYKVERVQQSAARYEPNDYDYTSSVTQMQWNTLAQRRKLHTLVMLY